MMHHIHSPTFGLASRLFPARFFFEFGLYGVNSDGRIESDVMLSMPPPPPRDDPNVYVTNKKPRLDVIHERDGDKKGTLKWTS